MVIRYAYFLNKYSGRNRNVQLSKIARFTIFSFKLTKFTLKNVRIKLYARNWNYLKGYADIRNIM